MPRRWFQIHLSTAVVLMLATGILIGLSLCGGSRYTPDIFTRGYEPWSGQYGWPIGFSSLEPPDHISFLIDLFVNITLILLIGYACEFRIRRREARKP